MKAKASGAPLHRIRYTDGISQEVRSAIEPHLAKWEFLIPAWCRELSVVWDDDDNQGAMRTEAYYEYRRAELYVLPNFLTVGYKREQKIVHELMHIVAEPLVDTMHHFRDALVKQVPDIEEWANEAIRRSMESVVEDLAAIMFENVSAP